MAPTAGQFATTRGALARLTRELPGGAAGVLVTLRRARGAAYLVGGAVRDAFLGRTVLDWDIATDLEPGQVARLFPRVVLAGAKHGTVMVLTRTGPVEVTTFRGEGPYIDGRRPSHVVFHSDLEADLARRDFTINAMAAELDARRLVDPFSGEKDLRRRRIRCVGDARARFEEDGLRPLRALRFAATLGFTLEPATRKALSGSLATFELVALERKRDEMEKLLAGGQLRSVLPILASSGMLAMMAPQLASTPGWVWGRLDRLLPEPYLRLAAWAAGARLTPDEAGAVVAGWRGSKRDQTRVAACVSAVGTLRAGVGSRELRHWVADVGQDPARDAARAAAALWPRRFANIPGRLGRVLRAQPPLTVADLEIDGNDLLAMGLGGKRIGVTLSALLKMVLDRPSRNRKTQLLDLAHRLSTGSQRDTDPDR